MYQVLPSVHSPVLSSLTLSHTHTHTYTFLTDVPGPPRCTLLYSPLSPLHSPSHIHTFLTDVPGPQSTSSQLRVVLATLTKEVDRLSNYQDLQRNKHSKKIINWALIGTYKLQVEKLYWLWEMVNPTLIPTQTFCASSLETKEGSME